MAHCGPIRPSRRSKYRALALIGVHGLVAGHLAHWWLSGKTLTPVEPSEAMQTLELGLVNCGFVFFVASILLTLVFGRFFCGWACHIVALQDLCAWLLKKAKLKPKPVRSRLLSLVPLGAALYMFVWPTAKRLGQGNPAPELQAHFTTTEFWATFPGPVVSILTFLVVGFLVVWWLGAKGFCTYGCPYGGIFGVVDRVSPGRILVNENCDGCAHCTATCTSNVRVHEEVKLHKMVVDAGCMKCMDCVSVCPKEALRFGFAKPSLLKFPRRTWDFSWTEELVMAGVFLAAFLLAIRGLYGQVPLLLSFGLSVLAATATIVLARLLTRPMLAWQHLLLKKDRRLTRSGWVVATLSLLYLAFVAHSAVVQRAYAAGEDYLVQARQARSTPVREELRVKSETAFLRADGLGLIADPRVDFGLGQLAYLGGNWPTAEARMRRAVASDRPILATMGRLWLGNALIAQRRLPEAETVFVELLARDPDNRDAQTRLAEVRAQLQRRQ